MAQKDGAGLAAVIDIGSSILSMEIAQGGSGALQELGRAHQPWPGQGPSWSW